MRVFLNRPVSYCMLFFLTVVPCLSGASDRVNPFMAKNGRLVTDQSGRKIHVEKPFRRIISLYGAHTENLFSLGLADRIIGVSRSEVFPPKARTKKVFSYHDDPEKFMAAKPDLVLIRPMIDRGYPRFVQSLEKRNITVVSLQPGNLHEMYLYWEILGILTGRVEESRVMKANFKSAIRAFQSLTDTLSSRKQVYFEAIHGKMKTFTPESISMFVLETAGGINVAIDAKSSRGTNIAVYGKEQILSHAPRIDVYLAQYGSMNRPTEDMIKNEPGFHIIKAVRNNEVYIIDEMIVSRPTPRLILGIFEIGTILYPTVFNREARSILNYIE